MPTLTRPSSTTAARLAALLSIVILAAACAGAASAPAPDAERPAIDGGTSAVGGAPSQPDVQVGEGYKNPDGSNPVLLLSRPDLLIIKTGNFTLQVADVLKAADSATVKIGLLGGYASGSQQGGDGDEVWAWVTYRLPADRWDDAVAALRALALKVVDAQTQTQDVSGQVVDLGARIANLKVTERALQDIMNRATKISDVLEVQAQLTTVRGDIERAMAEEQHLKEQAAFSTLTAQFVLKPDAAITQTRENFDPESEIDRATAALVTILQGLATGAIWFAIVWLPVLLVVGVLVLAGFLVIRRRRTAGPGSEVSLPLEPGTDIAAPPPEG